MKCLSISIVWFVLMLASMARAQDVTPKMEATFLDQLKASVTHKNYSLFYKLLDKDEATDPTEVLKVRTIDPFATLFSDSSRTYQFGPPANFSSDTSGSWTLWKFDGPGMSHHVEDKLKVVKVLTITFSSIPIAKVYPTTSPLDVRNGKQWKTQPVVGVLPLVVDHGKLLIVEASSVGSFVHLSDRDQ